MSSLATKQKVYGKPLKPEVADQQSLSLWGVLGIVMIFLLWAPFQRGLFNGYTSDFDRPIFSSYIWAAIIMVTLAVFLFSKWQLRTHRDLISLFVWLLPVCFFLSSINAASSFFASNMTYLHIMYAVFFMVGLYLTKISSINRILQVGLMASAYILVLFGLLYWFGNGQNSGTFIYTLLNWFGLAQYRDAVMADSNGIRLTSSFQYANTYGAFLIAVLLASLFSIVKSRKWLTTSIHAFMLVPVCVSLMLTLSRGALVILPVVLLVCLLFFSLYRQLLVLVYFVLSFAVTLLILASVTNIGQEISKQFSASSSWKGWLTVIVSSLVLSAVISVVQHYVEPYLKGKTATAQKWYVSFWIIPAAAALLGGLGLYLLLGNTGFINILPDSVKTRVENINFAQHSVLERGTFYKDSIKLVKDYPILGAGGGGWAALYEKYQNNPYTSRQAHNFYLQYLVETGILGTVVLTIFLFYGLYLFIRTYFRSSTEQKDARLLYFIIAISLLIHSIIDFNMSYAYIAALLFLCLGAMIGGPDDTETLLKFGSKISAKASKAFPILLGVFAVVFLIISVRLLTADKLYKSAYAAAQGGKASFQEIMTSVDKAIDRNPSHPEYSLFKSNILSQAYEQTKDEKYFEEASSTIQDILQKDPNNRFLMMAKYSQLMKKGNLDEAEGIMNQALINFPWEITMYEEAISFELTKGDKARSEQKKQDAERSWNHALQLYDDILVRMKELQLLPKEQTQGREFYVTDRIAFAIGQIHFLKGDFASASTILKAGANEQKFDNQMNRLMTRWYLASLQKQQQNDQGLYNKLIAKDPNEAAQIQTLVNAPLLQ
ncbi:O-antigen ligase family protein [Paenibacillus sp. MBLB4367]|uniref:O-antigen ligase family protein n=1 Tax=Paenibacillus sp. MBLB4367 TaxID=3384767 RepID=UPI003907F661